MRKHRNRSGYPAEYLCDARRALRNTAMVIAIAGALAALLIYWAICSDVPLSLAARAGAVWLFVAWVGCCSALDKPLLALYFENEVPGESAWSKVLARNCTHLDALASEVSTLSSFGFSDDLSGETVVWHYPQRGLETVAQLLQRLRAEPEILPDSAAICADLEKMRARLQQACETDTRFCLILHCNSVNGQEIEMRRGHF